MGKRLAVSAVVGCCIALSACSPAVVKTYKDPSLGKQQIGILKGWSRSAYGVSFASYADTSLPGTLNFNRVGNTFTGFPREVHILPGRYLVMAYCTQGNGYSFPSLPVEVKAGNTYEIECEPASTGGKVRARLATVYASAAK